MSRSDLFALLFSLLAVLAGFLVHDRIFERLAHLEDEMAYVWQAQTIAGGHISLPSPPNPKSFLVPFVVDYNGHRFGKYPLGWPLLLAVGERLGVRFLVNPLLGGLAVWLTYLLGKRFLSETVGLLAAGLTLTSPFFLMNTGSLLAHPLGLVLSAGFVYAWLRAFGEPVSKSSWRFTLISGFCLGALVLTRPFTALAVGAPFVFHGGYLLVRGDNHVRLRLFSTAAVVLGAIALHFLWQYAVTGDPFLNPYTLWWEYDRIGFGIGAGRKAGGHTLQQAWINTRQSLKVGAYDLFGWMGFSWLFLPFGLFVYLRERNWRAVLLSGVFPSLVFFYLAYWIGSSLFGPRYFYEGLFSLTLTSAAGIAFLAGWPVTTGVPFPNYPGWRKIRPLGVTALSTFLVAYNLFVYTPMRLDSMRELYGVTRQHMQPFLSPSAQEFTPALVVVHPQKEWIEYGTLIELQNPYLDTPFIFIYSRGNEVDREVARYFPQRHVYHYYQDDPYIFYTAPRPK